MEGTIILVCLIIFFIGIFLVKETPESDQKLENLIAEVERKEALLKRIDYLNKQWDELIMKRSLALKESTLENYKKIDSEIEVVKFTIETLLDNEKP